MTSSLLKKISPLALLSCTVPMAHAAAPVATHAQAAAVAARAGGGRTVKPQLEAGFTGSPFGNGEGNIASTSYGGSITDNGYGGQIVTNAATNVDTSYGGQITSSDNGYGGQVGSGDNGYGGQVGGGEGGSTGGDGGTTVPVGSTVATAPQELASMTAVQTDKLRLRMKATQSHLRDVRADTSVLPVERRHQWNLYITDNGDDVKHSASPSRLDDSASAASTSDLGFNSRINTVTFGADHRLGDDWVVGGALGASAGHVSFDSSASDQRSHGVDATVYASWGFLPSAYVSAAASFDSTDFDVLRATANGGQAYSSPHGNGLAFSLAGGYDFVRGAFSLSPYARLDSVSSHVDSYREFELFSADGLAVDRQTVRSSTTNLGLQMQYAVPVSWGVVLPQARVEFTRENSPSRTAPGAHLLSDNATLIGPIDVQQDRHYGVWAVGVSTLGQRGLSGFADFESNFSQEGYRTRHFTIGFRAEL